MHDAVDAVLRNHALDEAFVAGIADEQRHAFRHRGGEAGGEVVDHDDGLVRVDERANHMAADIAGTAGDKHGHDVLTSPFCRGDYPSSGEEGVSAAANWRPSLMLRIGDAAKTE